MEKEFLWGVAQSGFQFEMGDRFNRHLDIRSDWWKWVRDPTNLKKGLVSGDLPEEGINNYELYPIDHLLAKKLGANAYSLNLEWSRIFPCATYGIDVDYELDSNGLIKEVKITKEVLEELNNIANIEEVEHYMSVLSNLKKMGFKVFITIVHYTHPLWLHDPIESRETNLKNERNGWVNQRSIIEFTKFAAYLAYKFGHLVDMWTTFNEPMVMVELGYLAPYSGFPPGVISPENAKKAIINIINAHARAYEAIKNFSKAPVGIIANNVGTSYPKDPNNPKDVKAAEMVDFFHSGLLLKALTEGELNAEFDMETMLKVPHLKRLDWIGMTYYSREVITHSEPKFKEIPITAFKGVPGYGYSCPPNESSLDGHPVSDIGWEVYPEGIYNSIKAASSYGKPIYIMENGIADSKDLLRPYFIASHIDYIEKAIEEGFDVRGYFHWALTDNYEWAMGFRMRFGLYVVDMITKERIPRKESVGVYREIIENDGITDRIRKEYLRGDMI
ncbi:beta-galactosidase BgaS [Thermococcus sibiricus]|uniref:Beta-galactosidase n=1 Tax=Thermococcus sibiricus (strain DSM 12597 / MM 739) TaxID=604354 RepID=C6A195_THESM|nr:beta-galactosidase BgaS [Thermococcus sibiricus]ACS89390.1 Beta-galactosidase [Thermococcus sibiricus MM 739]